MREYLKGFLLECEYPSAATTSELMCPMIAVYMENATLQTKEFIKAGTDK